MRKYIKILLLTFIFILTSLKPVNNILHQDFGVYKFSTNQPHTFTSYRLFIIKRYINEQEKNISFMKYDYEYRLIGVSYSQYYGHLRNTYMQGFEMYLDHNENPINQYPLSFYIEKEPTTLYVYKSNNPNINFYIQWNSSYYDARK